MYVSLILILVVVFALLALGGFIARTARERGRSATAWVALAVAAMIVGGVVGAWSLAVSIVGGDDTAVSLGKVTFGLIGSFFGPLGGMLVVLGMVRWLPERVPTIVGARWRVYRLSSPDEPAGECLLEVDGRALHVGDWCIAPGMLDELAADGECLRVVSGGKTRVLMPAGAGLSAKEKSKQSQALAKRLRALVG